MTKRMFVPKGPTSILTTIRRLFVPASGPVAKAIEESNRSFGTGIFALGFVNPALGSFLEYRVGGDPDRIEHFEGFQGPVDLWSGRAGIGPIADLTFREATFKDRNAADKAQRRFPLRPRRCRGGAEPKARQPVLASKKNSG